MNLLVVVLLGGLWASILLPGAIRNRRHSSPISSVDSFERSMGILAPDRVSARSDQSSTGRRVLVVADPGLAIGASRTTTVRRRRAVLGRLAAALVATAVAAILLGGIFLFLFAVCLTAAVGYLLVLVQTRAREEQARRTVRRLPVRPCAETDDAAKTDEAADVVSATVRVFRWGA